MTLHFVRNRPHFCGGGGLAHMAKALRAAKFSLTEIVGITLYAIVMARGEKMQAGCREGELLGRGQIKLHSECISFPGFGLFLEGRN